MNDELRQRAGGDEVVEFMESNDFKLVTSQENQYGYWFNQNDQMTIGLPQAKYMFNLIKSRDQQIALAARIDELSQSFLDKDETCMQDVITKQTITVKERKDGLYERLEHAKKAL